MENDDALIVDDGDLRKYRIELPNLIDDLGLSPHAFRLYVHIKRRAGSVASGYCWEGTKGMATACQMSTGKVSEAKAELVAANLITIERRANEGKTDIIRLKNIWPANFAKYTEPDSPDILPESPVDQLPPVHNMKTTPSQYEQPFHNMKQRKNHDKKEPEEKNTNERAPDLPAQRNLVCGSCGSCDVTPLRNNDSAGTCRNPKCKGAGKSGFVNLTPKKKVMAKSPAPPPDELTAALVAWFRYNGDERAESAAANLRGRYEDAILTRAVNELAGRSVRGPWAYICKVADRIKTEKPTPSIIPSTSIEDERQRLYMKLRREMPEQPDSCIWIGVAAAIKAQQANI